MTKKKNMAEKNTKHKKKKRAESKEVKKKKKGRIGEPRT
jgi:hypothetical protein